MSEFLLKIKRLFCRHDPYPYRSLNDPDHMVCKKCGKNYYK